jgi:hypothetical protein
MHQYLGLEFVGTQVLRILEYGPNVVRPRNDVGFERSELESNYILALCFLPVQFMSRHRSKNLRMFLPFGLLHHVVENTPWAFMILRALPSQGIQYSRVSGSSPFSRGEAKALRKCMDVRAHVAIKTVATIEEKIAAQVVPRVKTELSKGTISQKSCEKEAIGLDDCEVDLGKDVHK